MQIKVVGHHGGANDADDNVDHSGITEMRRQECMTEFEEAGLGLGKNEDFDEVANADCRDQHQDDGFDGAHTKSLEPQQEEHVESRDDYGPEQRNVKQEIQSDRAAQD